MFIFDFDETLTVRSSSDPIDELAHENLSDIDYRYEKVHHCWNRRMNEVHKRLVEQGIQTEQQIETFGRIELDPGVRELFHDISMKNGKIIVMSNACDLVIRECLQAQNLFQYVHKIESNPVRQTHPVIVIDEYENPLQTQCKICEPNLCKGSIIDRYRENDEVDRIIFIGDGDNDSTFEFFAVDFSSTILEFTKYCLEQVRYDRKRVQEIGPDRACAEWLVRCGGSVRFKNWGTFSSHFNTIPAGASNQFKIEEIRAINASITSEGFAYLDGLSDLKKIHLEKCDQICDSSIARCNKVKDSLESIELIDLAQISENGLAYLAGLKNLKHIVLARLSSIKHRDAILKLLTNELPRCTINYNDEHAITLEQKAKKSL
ncbi:unnamed protein product [Rotaria socialis]|uniref:Uncharacterized protein n=1 Tax=Rotaria socialis TaxID=392032 RepID=A0A817UD52_9BILA|nr:unnamed protein product [Rotaria socialis]CAF3698523.1 unnamed protein product [Rotaria socialis]